MCDVSLFSLSPTARARRKGSEKWRKSSSSSRRKVEVLAVTGGCGGVEGEIVWKLPPKLGVVVILYPRETGESQRRSQGGDSLRALQSRRPKFQTVRDQRTKMTHELHSPYVHPLDDRSTLSRGPTNPSKRFSTFSVVVVHGTKQWSRSSPPPPPPPVKEEAGAGKSRYISPVMTV